MSITTSKSFQRAVSTEEEFSAALLDIKNGTLTECLVRRSRRFNPDLLSLREMTRDLCEEMDRAISGSVLNDNTILITVGAPPKNQRH
ncbi:MAG TPA: hypothetical protein PLF01_05335 [Alphaproteobacteria bacterium]|nr:hypothetical protein [Alphaproteobacteria bacterium]